MHMPQKLNVRQIVSGGQIAVRIRAVLILGSVVVELAVVQT